MIFRGYLYDLIVQVQALELPKNPKISREENVKIYEIVTFDTVVGGGVCMLVFSFFKPKYIF
jgi:hypothetical protein